MQAALQIIQTVGTSGFVSSNSPVITHQINGSCAVIEQCGLGWAVLAVCPYVVGLVRNQNISLVHGREVIMIIIVDVH